MFNTADFLLLQTPLVLDLRVVQLCSYPRKRFELPSRRQLAANKPLTESLFVNVRAREAFLVRLVSEGVIARRQKMPFCCLERSVPPVPISGAFVHGDAVLFFMSHEICGFVEWR